MSNGKSIYDVFAMSEEAENNGQWFNYGEGPTGQKQRFCLARKSRSNKKYTAAIARMNDEYGHQIQAGTMPEDLANDLLLDIFCRTILVNWEGIPDREGKSLAHSVENAKALMEDLPELYAELDRLSSMREHFRQVQNVDDAGN